MSVGIQPSEYFELRNKKRDEWFLHNAEACQFIDIFMECVEFTDDLIDKDKDISNERILHNMASLMIRLPNNNFFLNHRHYLTPLIVTTLFTYKDSEALKHSANDTHKMLAFHLRNFSLELYHATAFCVGGWQHLEKVSLEIREFFALENYREWEYG